MNRLKFLLVLILLLPISKVFSQSSFKELYYQAFEHLQEEEYKKALPILFEMFEMNHKNANTAFSIGNCYLNTPNARQKAIPFYEEALKKLTPDYRGGYHKEKKAPLETYRYLGQAYHFNYEFEKALEQYEIYKSILDPKNKEDRARINRDIEITRNAIELKNRPVKITVETLDVLNTEFDEYRPKLNAEENLLFFTSRRKGDSEDTDHEGKYYEDVYFSVKEKDYWTTPVRVGDSINSDSHDACLYISPDAQLMYVYRFDEGSDAGGSIYESRKSGDKWTEPVRLNAKINSKYWETDASLNSFGNAIFFTSERPGGYGDRDIWMMKKLPNGKWADIQNLGDIINTPYDEESPYFHPDGKTLYFSSKGHKTMGGFDVFSSELQEDGSWSDPINLGYPINTTGDDVFYFPSLDRKRAYFSSYREDGKGEQDIYMMTLEMQKPSALAIYKGISMDCKGDVVKNLLVSISDKETGEVVGEFRPNEETGEFLFILNAGRSYDIDYLVDNASVKENIIVRRTGGLRSGLKEVVNCGDSLVVTNIEMDIDTTDMIATVFDKTNNQPVNSAKVRIYTMVDGVKTLGKTITTGENGKWVHTFDENTDFFVEISATGYNTESFNIAKDDENRQAKLKDLFHAMLTPEDQLTQVEVDSTLSSGGTLTIKSLYFVYDQVNLIDESQPDLKKVLTYLEVNKDAKLLISGHTDSKGDEKYNQWLSSARANKIKNYLFKAGVKSNRIVTKGYGESKPIAPNQNADGSDNPEGRQKNRRVEFSIIK